MNIPTPETNAAIEAGSDPWDLVSRLEQRLTIARTALESITHDMSASPYIYSLCKETLEQTAPKQ